MEAEVAQEGLVWKTASRDDKAIAQAIAEGEEIEAIHELSEAGLLDEFFVFLEELGMMKELEELKLGGARRVLVPTIQFVLLYLLKVLFGGKSMNELPKLLFSHEGLMKLVGFNAVQIKEGMTKRGDKQRKSKPKAGPISAQCLAQNICKLDRGQMEGLFNAMVECLARWGFFSGKLMVALDGSKLPTTKKYQGCGKLKETKKVKVKGQKELGIQEYFVYGWKVLVLIEVQTRLPLAMKVVQIQEYEGRWLLPLVQQAQKNLLGFASISKVVADRGYLDGEDLWQLHLQGFLFVVVAKAGMLVAIDAQSLAKEEPSQQRVQVIKHGHGKNATEEQLRTELVGIEALTTYDAYGDPEQTKHRNRKDFAGQPINAVVVQLWNNRAPSTDGIVYLTNGPVNDPFVVFDDYDWRSVIENGIFKEGKHPWHLGQFPQKTEAGVVVHCHFTLLVMALCTAFRLWQAKPQEREALQCSPETPLSTTLLCGEGTARWRLRLKEENRDKVIVFVGELYGIFLLAELAVLLGACVKGRNRQALLSGYGLGP
jgi:Transposase DDE domain